jgi:hypothetical protein
MVRATVEEIVNSETQPMESRLINQLEGIIGNCQHQVYANYRLAHGSQDPSTSLGEASFNIRSGTSAPTQFCTPINPQQEPLGAPMPSYTQFDQGAGPPLLGNYVPAPFEQLPRTAEPSRSSTQVSLSATPIIHGRVEDDSNQMAPIQAPQSEARLPDLPSFQNLPSSQTSSSNDNLEWSMVPSAEDTMDSNNCNVDDASFNSDDRWSSNEFDLDNYIRLGGNELGFTDEMP